MRRIVIAFSAFVSLVTACGHEGFPSGDNPPNGDGDGGDGDGGDGDGGDGDGGDGDGGDGDGGDGDGGDGDGGDGDNLVRAPIPPCESGRLSLRALVCDIPLRVRGVLLQGDQLMIHGVSKTIARVDLSEGEAALLDFGNRDVSWFLEFQGSLYARVDNSFAEFDLSSLESMPLFPLPDGVIPAFCATSTSTHIRRPRSPGGT